MPSSPTLRSQPPNTGIQYPNRISGLPPRATREVIDQALEWIESDHARPVGDEVGQGVDVVDIGLAVAVVDQVLDAADVELAAPRDREDGRALLGGRLEGLDAQAVLDRVERARGAHQLLAARGLAGVGRAQVERADLGVDLDRIEVFAA